MNPKSAGPKQQATKTAKATGAKSSAAKKIITKTTAAKKASAKPVAERRRGSARARQAADAMSQLLLDAAPAEVDRVLKATKGASGETLDSALWGPAPDREEVAAGVVANLRKQFDARRVLETMSVTRADVGDLLGISDQAVTDALEARRLLGLKRGRQWMIPAWQLDADAERGVVPGLADLAAVFPGGVVALSSWVARPSPDLDGRTPRDVLARGDVETVVQLARRLTAAGW
jgi:hypothetical protein